MNDKGINRVSLALNVLLLSACVILFAGRQTVIPNPPPQPIPSQPVADVPVTRPDPMPVARAARVSDRSHWVDTLRSQGIPESVIARLVMADFDDRWEARQSEAQEAYNRGDINSDALAKLDIEHAIEQEKELRDALGEEGFKNWDKHRLLQDLNLKNIDLTDAESDSLYGLKKKLEGQLRDLDQQKLNGDIDQAALEDGQQKAQADYDQQLETLLGDDRLRTMQGADNFTGDLQRNLHGLNVGDDQMATLSGIQSNWDASRAQLVGLEAKSNDVSYEQQIKELDKARDQQFQQVLGTNGFEAYQEVQDSRYTDMKQYASLWGISATDIDYVYHTIQYYETSVQDYQQQGQSPGQPGQPTDPDIVKKNIRQFSQQTEQSLRSYLGDDRFNTLKQNGIIKFND